MTGSGRKIALVCSHGGHLTEMLELAAAFDGLDTFYFTYEGETTRGLPRAYVVPNRPGHPVEFMLNVIRVRRIFRQERPDFVVSTGAEIAIPAFIVAKWMRIPTLYIECGCQVTEPSFTGRFLSRIATRFLVQWPELVDAYGGRAEYAGSLIDEARS